MILVFGKDHCSWASSQDQQMYPHNIPLLHMYSPPSPPSQSTIISKNCGTEIILELSFHKDLLPPFLLPSKRTPHVLLYNIHSLHRRSVLLLLHIVPFVVVAPLPGHLLFVALLHFLLG